MSYSISEEKLENLPSHLQNPGLKWPFPFVLPAWLQVWWQVFGDGNEPYLRVVKDGEDVIGIAPLMVKDDTARFIGDTDVCDFQDFIVHPGRQEDFLNTLLDDVTSRSVNTLDLAHVRPDSIVLTGLAELARQRGYPVEIIPEEVSLEMPLPGDFDDYLGTLNRKQRHEIRRKLRRLGEAGETGYRLVTEKEAVPAEMGVFFRMFTDSRHDKANFLTERMETFFRSLAAALAESGILRIGVLELDARPIASVICFDYANCRYLYNCGYDPQYTGVSAGLISKIFTIKDCIENGIGTFDFLKGEEAYKHHLGGREVPLSRCRITLNKD
ncbi:MAG: GNAT family N-acetyltransferase [Dehalococcoidales bacterium]|nr:GNAT family N-acetyltransferase [Dehalococcoidales bacterium]